MISTRTFLVAVGLFLTVILLTKARFKSPEYSYFDIITEATSRCLTYSDTLFKERLADYRKAAARVLEKGELHAYFRGFGMGSPDLFPGSGQRMSACLEHFFLDSSKESQQGLLTSGRAYIQAFNELRPVAQAIEVLYSSATIVIDHQEAAQLDESFNQRLAQLQKAEVPFRQAFEPAQLLMRAQQLQQIEQNLGRDQHWHMLNFMLLARRAMDRLEGDRTLPALTATELSASVEELQRGWQAAHLYHEAYPRLSAVGGNKAVWLEVEASAKRWLDRLATLQQHWSLKASPTALDADLRFVQHDYDQLLARYDATVGSRY
ncbi:DUF3829 domain-containing protein [Pseudomonas oryzihabitans]|uniref:DUF3829 domain-containing protein n=1 Tax=Pseudomonas oryzihabitans TaxID=47885 RepID=UPI0028962306|nr:DUF3829 domain-containing protein [Pseudomonas oryzihabitans]MDT3722926.1 DUF3829 domain-containing protein [Pseudomonas oryzihabitans]